MKRSLPKLVDAYNKAFAELSSYQSRHTRELLLSSTSAKRKRQILMHDRALAAKVKRLAGQIKDRVG